MSDSRTHTYLHTLQRASKSANRAACDGGAWVLDADKTWSVEDKPEYKLYKTFMRHSEPHRRIFIAVNVDTKDAIWR